MPERKTDGSRVVDTAADLVHLTCIKGGSKLLQRYVAWTVNLLVLTVLISCLLLKDSFDERLSMQCNKMVVLVLDLVVLCVYCHSDSHMKRYGFIYRSCCWHVWTWLLRTGRIGSCGREKGIEKQFRYNCELCDVCVAYRPVPYEQDSKYVYVFPEVGIQGAHILDIKIEKLLPQ